MAQRALLLAAFVLTASALLAQEQMYATPPPSVPMAPSFPSSITFATGLTVPALPGQSTADGQLTFTAPFIEGQARAALASIAHIKFPRGREAKQGAFAFRLVNGDRIVGDLVALDQNVVVIDSAILGELEIPRNIVHSIKQRGKSPVLIDTDFARDGMDVWKTIKGKWHETDKGLSVKVSRHIGSTLVSLAPHDGPVTLVVNMDATANPKPKQQYDNRFQVTFSLFTSTVQRDRRRDALDAVFTSRYSEVRLCTDGQTFPTLGPGWAACKGDLRIAYDPATFTVQVWLGEERIVNNTLDGGPKSGRYVRIRSNTLVDLHSARLLRGIVPPGKEELDPADDTDSIILLNGDRVGATKLEVEDEQAVLRDPNGNEFEIDLGRISYVVMRKKGRRALPRRKDDVRVRLPEMSVQLKLSKLTDKVLISSSAALGEMNIPRAALAAIDCDLLGEKRAAYGKFQAKNNSVIELPGGAVLPATIDSIGDGFAVIAAPWLSGTARVKLAELAHMKLLHVARPEPGGELLFLTDGSHVAGSLQKISAEAFELDTPFMGAFKPARKFVQSVGTNQEPTLIEATDFTTGTMGKWHTAGGPWELKRNGLLSAYGSGVCFVTMKLPHDGPITAEVVVERAPDRPSLCARFGISAAKPTIGKIGRGRDRQGPDALNLAGILFDFAPLKGQAATTPHGRRTPLFNNLNSPKPATNPFLTRKRGIITIAWDPTTDRVTVWADGRFMAAAKVKGEPRGGKHFMLGSPQGAVIFKSVRIWKGFAAAGAIDNQSVADNDVAIDEKGQVTQGATITMADGKVHLPADDGDRTCALTDMRTILTARNSRTVVPRKPEHVRVGLARSVILLRLKSMDAKFLAGVSPTLGAVRIPRDAVRWIDVRAPVPKPANTRPAARRPTTNTINLGSPRS